jgi:hypothetical protein
MSRRVLAVAALGKSPCAMPAAFAVEELRAAWPENRHEVFEIGQGGGKRAEARGIGDSAAGREQADAEDPACNLERPIVRGLGEILDDGLQLSQ